MSHYDDAHANWITSQFAANPVLEQISQNIQEAGLPPITIRAEEGRFLQFLVRSKGARNILEIGTHGGYSGSWMALGLPPGGKLTTLELEQDRADLARSNFQLAGVSDQVEILVGDAHETLKSLPGGYDFVFIDAEKTGYVAYATWAIDHVAAGATIALHNAFRGGCVIDPTNNEEDTVAMRDAIALLREHPRVLATIYPAGDGTLLGVVGP